MKLRSWLHRSFHLHEQQRLERESAESVHLASHALSLKAKLSPLVGVIVALGTGLVLWYGGALVVGGILSAGSRWWCSLVSRRAVSKLEEALAGRKPAKASAAAEDSSKPGFRGKRGKT